MTTDELITIRAQAIEAEKKWREVRDVEDQAHKQAGILWNAYIEADDRLKKAFEQWRQGQGL